MRGDRRASDRGEFTGLKVSDRAGHWDAALSELAEIPREPSRGPGR
jgi:hypothetical protein